MGKTLNLYKNRKIKIFVMAYARKNVGDDLFIKMLLEKHPEIDFFMKIKNQEYLNFLAKYENLHILVGADTDDELYYMNVEEYDGYVYIGGSIFMEGGRVYNLSPKFYNFVKRCKLSNKPFCYISSNYGPYQTQEYFELSKENFRECTDICFRDKYSYNLFKEIQSVRYAPDYAFSYEIKKQEKIVNSVGISVVNVESKNSLKNKQEEYISLLVKNIKKYIEEGSKVYLFSYCKYEGDEVTIDKILKELPNNENVIAVRYDGDLDKFFEIYAKMEYMICARFHAMILSCILRQKMYVMSYSDKIDNVIEDLGLDLKIIRLESFEKDRIIDKKDFSVPEEEKILRIIEDAKKQDKVFEESIKNKVS